ncbi:60S acidic ribosomal protein P2-2-like [Pyrus ussuriensis x Pyrus communis]|uniref:60S acidic ribosomal protein P2-2-like n=1 Tax=Pyrus ussuriensis x Pyrus communis TaxID=2448454 RepID=A0A5N5GEU1_9ROSA|nr:60S acidic ribosomal protein P2-2-like [Pyrus ussuriensis x Pyrus communis]
MKVVAAYLLAVLGGKTTPTAEDIKDILGFEARSKLCKHVTDAKHGHGDKSVVTVCDRDWESIQFANSDKDLDVYDHIVQENIEDNHALTVEDQGDNIPGDDTTEHQLQRVMHSLAAILNDIPSHGHNT